MLRGFAPLWALVALLVFSVLALPVMLRVLLALAELTLTID